MFLLNILQKIVYDTNQNQKTFRLPHHHPHSICYATHNKGVGQKKRERGVTESKRSKHREDLERILWGLKVPKKCSKFCDNNCLTLRLNFQKLRSLLSKLTACNVHVRVCSVCVHACA